MHFFKPIIATALIAMSGTIYAETTKSIHLIINFVKGGSTCINVQDGIDPNNLPTMNISSSSVTVTVPQLGKESQTYTYEATGIYNFYFDKLETSAIGQAVVDDKAAITAMGGGLIRVNSSIATDVIVHDLSGRQVDVEKSTDGSATIVSLDGLGSGVYIVSYKDATLKITKK
ncbi:MAG: T9SS type A sorting domain-containing protein [Bacteroides sp.]|nr:T9SS type A sorting domain-containing protein [Bacteroides sp.]